MPTRPAAVHARPVFRERAGTRSSEAQGSIRRRSTRRYPGNRATTPANGSTRSSARDRTRESVFVPITPMSSLFGASANAAVSRPVRASDVVLGFDFAHGGHPTQYAAETFAGRNYQAFAYHVGATTARGHGRVEMLASRHRPKVLFAGWSCYSRHLDFARSVRLRRSGRRPGGRHGALRRLVRQVASTGSLADAAR